MAPSFVVFSLIFSIASQGVKDKNDDPDARLILNLTKSGEVLVDESELAFGNELWRQALGTKPGLKRMTLDQLGVHLDVAKRTYDIRQREKGGSGYEQLRESEKISRLFVLLRADKDAPWLHVQWLTIVMQEQKFHKLQFAVKVTADRSYAPEEAALMGVKRDDVASPAPPALESKLSAFLPQFTDPDLEIVIPPDDSEDEEHTAARKAALAKVTRIRVEIHADAEVAVKEWGKLRRPASVPTQVHYVIGGRKTQSLADVEKWINRQVAAAKRTKKRPVWQMNVDANVQVKYAIAVLDRMSAAGAERVWFSDWRIPGAELRRLPHLPYPK